MRLPGEEETREKIRLSAGNGCLLLPLLSVSTLIKNVCVTTTAGFSSSLGFLSGHGNFKQWMFVFVKFQLCSAKEELPHF